MIVIDPLLVRVVVQVTPGTEAPAESDVAQLLPDRSRGTAGNAGEHGVGRTRSPR
ncbi:MULTISPECIES: hypothetical protein [Amycolatopsis]|uniref:hypothetical protein n=1 Tax=Amycolatopsis TaxID=1813 RepID=UPI001F16A16E|nr:hypothetical protein [Amycolatopsis tucumanensis]MCF6420676.1 hypothetical protein [Amycolatopsis tucumanensis]